MNQTAFARKASDFAAFRPPYASAGLQQIIDLAAVPEQWTVADIGAGTGHLTRHLVAHFGQVFAVEPDDAMRTTCLRLLHGLPAFTAVAAPAEAIPLPDASVDLITVGQALHWFEPAATQREFSRILRPQGWLGVIWNRYDNYVDPCLDGYFESDTRRWREYPMTIRETWAQFLGGSRSAARSPNPGDPGYAEFEQRLRRIFEARASGDLIEVNYTTVAVTGRLSRPVR
jgi:SAM-dependent methyltransferase